MRESPPATNSIDWYDANGQLFVARASDKDLMAGDLRRFAELLPAGGAVLEAGCGWGRDARALLSAGFKVTAFDGSAEMVRLAREHTGLPVQQLRFQDIAWQAEFDGVWACASLLHVPLAELDDVFARVAAALKPGGVFYASFKHGPGEREHDGRRFTDMTIETLRPRLERAGFERTDARISPDERRHAIPNEWVSALCVRRGETG
jgi:cyclopropane fatty-acyl-phospholipid synthase-like methyltransferase